MDESWRFRPIQPSLCPTCSLSHYPFCPQPHPFDRNGYAGENLRRFPPEINPPFHRPLQGPTFPDHQAAPPMPIPAPPARELEPPLHQPFHPLHGFHPEEFLERENFRKRMRVEDPIVGNFPPSQPFNRTAEDARRLDLIRSHGWQSAGPMDGEQQLNGEFRADGYAFEGSWNHQRRVGIDQSFYGPGLNFNARTGSGLPSESLYGRQNHPVHADAFGGNQNFQELPNSHGIDRFVPQERRDFQSGEFVPSKGGAFSPQIGEHPYGRKDQYDSSWQLPRSYRHGEYSESSENYVANPLEQQLFHDPQQRVSYPSPDYVRGVTREKYYVQDRQQIYPTESSSHFLSKQPEHPYPESYQTIPGMVNTDKERFYLSHGSTRQPLENKVEIQNQHSEVKRATFELKPPIPEEIPLPFDPQTYPDLEESKQGGYLPISAEGNSRSMGTTMMSQVHTSQTYPPLPLQHPIPVHPEPSPPLLRVRTTVQASHSMLTPAPDSTSATIRLPLNGQGSLESHQLARADFYREPPMHTIGFATEGLSSIHQTSSKECLEDRRQTFPLKNSLKDKPTIIDACQLFRQPYRASRPDHIVIILRGLPGSGKSYLAKALRDIEVESGGNAPRIHAMDDYFMVEVEKVEDSEGSKSSRGKKQIMKKVIEYCYEPDMEQAYRSSMLKAFKKTLDEGVFTFIIVDDRNLRVADFAQFWAIAKRSGYEVYLLEATYKDPTGCAARNVHGFTVDDIQHMAEQWEEAPALYLKLDIQSLFRGDDLNEHSIQEVDMDTDDAPCGGEETHEFQERDDNMTETKSLDYAPDGGLAKVGERWNTEEEEEPIAVKELGRSKWSKDLEEDIENSDGTEGNVSALSGLIQAYGKSEKSVHWGDKAEQSGFSIGAIKNQSKSSLIIGPGSGYNLDSNPLLQEEVTAEASGKSNTNETKRRFSEQLRAERESFKAVFDRRRQRIGGLWDAEDE